MKITVVLNGTDTNKYKELFGLKSNPFPQTADYEYAERCVRLQELGGEPIPHDHYQSYIVKKLQGFSIEFITICLQQFRPGQEVRFDVEWPG